jgi:hypothetical protein
MVESLTFNHRVMCTHFLLIDKEFCQVQIFWKFLECFNGFLYAYALLVIEVNLPVCIYLLTLLLTY